MIEMRMTGRAALITGASKGIGLAIATNFARAGASVAIAARRQPELEQARAAVLAAAGGSAKVLTISADIGSGPDCARAFKATESAFGKVDVLVNNAGTSRAMPFEDVTDEMWQQGFQSLWLSAIDAIRTALPGMRHQRWGRILLLTSTTAKEPIPGLTVSSGLRAGLLGLVKTLAPEVAEEGVTVNALLPGYTATARLAELGIPEETLAEHIPARRLGRPEELGAMAAFLASEQAGYVTGQAIAVDGGFIRGL